MVGNQLDDFQPLLPRNLTWNLQITHLDRKMIFQTSMIMVHVNLLGCTYKKCLEITKHPFLTGSLGFQAYVWDAQLQDCETFRPSSEGEWRFWDAGHICFLNAGFLGRGIHGFCWGIRDPLFLWKLR